MFAALKRFFTPRYRYHTGNMFRRYCKRCGQQQDTFTMFGDLRGRAWWEPMGLIKDADCRCHKDCMP